MSKDFFLYFIVEGHSEVDAVPVLLKKIRKAQQGNVPNLCVLKAHRIPKGKMFSSKKGEKRMKSFHVAREYIKMQQDKGAQGGVVILMDADSSCCQEFIKGRAMGSLLSDADSILGDIPYVVSLIEKEYESWLAAGLGGGENDGERWLKKYLIKHNQGNHYRKTQHQAMLSEKIDVKMAQEANSSFRRFVERILELPARATPRN